MSKISISRARDNFSEVVEQSKTEPVEIELYGRRAAVLVSPEKYDEMLEAWEDAQDVAAFDSSLGELGANIPWEQVQRDLGWA
jgi:prevent-host-death family protein